MRMQSKSLNIQIILTALFLLLTFNASTVFADFYVIAGSRGVGTKITSLPYTIASPGFYYIDKDLSCTSAVNHGIIITADNVTLDLMGFSLVGPGGTGTYNGIYMNARVNVEIRNGTVRNFNYSGIREGGFTTGTGHRIINIRVEGNQTDGIYLEGKSHLVKSCTSINNGGNGIRTGYASTITNNTCYNNVTGIQALQGCTVTGNTSCDNSTDGIYATAACTVAGNTCYNNQDDGIYAGTGSNVIGNTCCSNASHGIELTTYSLVEQNACVNNYGGNMNICTTCLFIENLAP